MIIILRKKSIYHYIRQTQIRKKKVSEILSEMNIKDLKVKEFIRVKIGD